MRTRVWLIAGLLAFCQSGLAAGEGGFYLAAGFGSADVDDRIAGLTIDDSDTGFHALLGFDIFPHFSVEGSYVDFGDIDASLAGPGIRTAAGIDGIALGSRYQYEFAHHLYFQARAGVFLSDIEATAASGSSVVAINEDDEDLYYGIGIPAAIRIRDSKMRFPNRSAKRRPSMAGKSGIAHLIHEIRPAGAPSGVQIRSRRICGHPCRNPDTRLGNDRQRGRRSQRQAAARPNRACAT